MRFFDITVPVRPGMPVYEGDPPVAVERVASIADGAVCNLSRLACGVHTGTHIDAPVHFIDGAPGVDGVALDALYGPAWVVDATGAADDIDRAALDALAIPADTTRVLFKTANSRLWKREGFSRDFIGLKEDAARALVERGVRLVAMDYLSVAPMSDPAPTHVALLEAGVVILEGVDLRRVEPGAYTLLCLPLLIEGADGAPARAVLMRA
jgi:arylformamidase